MSGTCGGVSGGAGRVARVVGNVAEARRIAALALDLSTGRDVTYAAAFALALTGDLRDRRSS